MAARAWADATRLFFRNPLNPLHFTTFGKSITAGLEVFERATRRYGRPEWRISSTLVGGERVPVHINTVWERPFCRLQHFERVFEHRPRRPLRGPPSPDRAGTAGRAPEARTGPTREADAV